MSKEWDLAVGSLGLICAIGMYEHGYEVWGHQPLPFLLCGGKSAPKGEKYVP